ncbi:hypothetical protein [Eisenbergiella sp.]|uniref:hypothetical protein n=1 Tax=Eisenbergiella sp. TaxID=1924109 RepID=UPI00208A19E8|nr:hypothetical protein [Eisenbergiella sp.]BDF47954.1 hypothetical protein CE91St56_50770 [Lachnospiraceae bacterium]GKH44029.1 hypothetical protein CE91St57_50030 [Lachnospiraceae bacterium]
MTDTGEERENAGIQRRNLWQFCDTRVSEEWFGPRPRTMNNKGVVDELRRKKLSYDVVKRLFREKGNYR